MPKTISMKNSLLHLIILFTLCLSVIGACTSTQDSDENAADSLEAVSQDTASIETDNQTEDNKTSKKLNRYSAKYMSPTGEYFSNEPGVCPKTGLDLIENPDYNPDSSKVKTE